MAIVENMTSKRTGRKVANQFIIEIRKGLAFQSYNSLIAIKRYGKLYVSDKWDYSATTLKYFKEFANLTGNTKKEIQQMIDDGLIFLKPEYVLEDMVNA